MKIFKNALAWHIIATIILVGLLALTATHIQAALLSTPTITSTFTPAPTFTATALPGAITWADQMIEIPDATDPVYKYQPPAPVLDELQADWEDIYNNYVLAPIWVERDRNRYLWLDTSVTPTSQSPSKTPVKAVATHAPPTTLDIFSSTHMTYQFIGCDQQGDTCSVSELLEQNFIVTMDLIKHTEIKRVPYPQSYLQLATVKWDSSDGLWKLVAKSLTSRKVQHSTETPTATHISQTASISTTAPTFTATALPGAITWADQMVEIPDATDPVYKYQPPQYVLDALEADWDELVTNDLFVPPGTKVDYSRYVWHDPAATPSPTPSRKTPTATPDFSRAYLVSTFRTFSLVGCNTTGDMCEIHDLWQQNMAVKYDPKTGKPISQKALDHDDLALEMMHWDSQDARWKGMYSPTLQAVQYVTATTTSP